MTSRFTMAITLSISLDVFLGFSKVPDLTSAEEEDAELTFSTFLDFDWDCAFAERQK